MSEVKNEGLEVVAWLCSWAACSYGGVHAGLSETSLDGLRRERGDDIQIITDEPLCRHSEALAGYAVRDAQIAELEAESAEWSPVMQRLGDENQQLRAELAAAKETIMRYETTAENCDLLRAELAAIKGQVPVAYISGCYRDVIGGKSDRTPLGAELAFVNMGWIGQIPLYAAPVSEAKAQGSMLQKIGKRLAELLDEDQFAEVEQMLARLNAAPVQQVSVPDCFESYRLADKFCEQRLVTDDRVRAIVVDAFASGYGFGIAAAPVAKQVVMPDADHSEDVRTMVLPDGYKLVPIEPTAAQCFTAAFNLCNEFGEEFVRDNKQFAMAAYRWLVAASPAAKGAKP